MTALRALAERESRHLDNLRTSEQGHLMIRLVHTECLLQLAKLSVSDLDMATYADLAVDTLEQFLPIDYSQLSIVVEDVPPVLAQRGDLAEGLEAASAGFRIGDHGGGEISMAVENPDLGPPEFLGAVAEQLSNGLTALARSEQLRRQAAVAEAESLISRLGEPTDADLQEVATALSYLPNVVGVELEVSHSVLESAVVATAGMRATEPVVSFDLDGGNISLAVAWATPPSDKNVGTVQEAVASLAAVLTRAEERRRLTVEAQTDPLTGIANRRAATVQLGLAIEMAAARDEQISIACFDLDLFKQVNDRFGHPLGDHVLVCFAKHLVASTRRTDIVARLGGEEFLVVYPGLDAEMSAPLVQRIIDGTPGACASSDAPGWTQTVSAGLASRPGLGTTSEVILAAADAALYRAKNLGRNRVEVDVPATAG